MDKINFRLDERATEHSFVAEIHRRGKYQSHHFMHMVLGSFNMANFDFNVHSKLSMHAHQRCSGYYIKYDYHHVFSDHKY